MRRKPLATRGRRAGSLARRRAAADAPEGAAPLTARDVALRVGVELKTVHNWAAQGLVPHFRTPGRHLRFHAPDVDEFLGRHEQSNVVLPGHLLVVKSRHRASLERVLRARIVTWQGDPLRALVTAGRERPGVIVIDSGCLGGLDPRGYVQALAVEVPKAELVWLGASPPPRRFAGRAHHCANVRRLAGWFTDRS